MVVPLEPSSEFWAGVGQSMAGANGDALVAAVGIVGALLVFVKWGLPAIKELREKRLEIDRFRIEVDERAAHALDDRERERIRNMAALVEQQRQNNENTKALATIMTALHSRLEESASRSHEMGDAVRHIRDTADDNNTILKRIDRRLIGGEGTD